MDTKVENDTNKDIHKPSLKVITKESKVALFFGAFYLCLGIVLGAFAAHGLKETLSAYQMGVMQTGVKYQLIHGLALLILGVLFALYQNRLFYIASISLIIGVFLFSFSLYAIAIFSISALGIITPIGGVFMIIAWIITMYAVVRNEK
jgi:uncharacterized membrane protein YgdD (TMEM256/DUF423 family)